MALRLIEMMVKEKDSDGIRELLKEKKLLEYRKIQLQEGEVLLRILLDAEQSEIVMDLLEKQYPAEEGNRLVVLPVEATLPRAEPKKEETLPGRIGREELYVDIKDAARLSKTYLMMSILATVVAAVGFYENSVIIIIGAMVIAPLIGPIVALSLATTLGDLSLLRHAILTSLSGIGISIALSVLISMVFHLDLSLIQMLSQTHIAIGNIVVALTSGCAGALAFTTGVSATLIGVMVAVALLPPLVVFGLLLGGGQFELALGALFLFLTNVICINLSGVATFLVQGVTPLSWWEKNRAKKATYIAIGLCVFFLTALVVFLLLLKKSGGVTPAL